MRVTPNIVMRPAGRTKPPLRPAGERKAIRSGTKGKRDRTAPMPPPSGTAPGPAKTLALLTEGMYVTRSCHRYADLLYQRMPAPEREIWRLAIKKPGITPYDLWMSEALVLLNQGLCPPDLPSISGGWSTSKVKEGTTHDPAPCIAAPNHTELTIEYHRLQPTPPSPFTRWLITDWWAPIPYEEADQSEVAVYFGWNPVTSNWAYHRSHRVGFRTSDIEIDSVCNPWLLQTDYYFSQGRQRRYHVAATNNHPWHARCAGRRPLPSPPGHPFPVPPNWT